MKKQMDDGFRPRCPSCDMGVDPRKSPKNLPFCSERCRLIDLGRWLDEEHTLPFDPHDQDEEAESASAQPNKQPKLPPGWHDA